MASVKELEKNKVQITFEITPEAFEAAGVEAYKKNKSRFVVEGFRKGKAPKKVIERVYGEEVFYEDALDIAFPEAYDKAIDETGIYPVSRPENFVIGDIKAGEAIVITADVYVKPEVKLGEYMGVAVEIEKGETAEAMVEKELEKVAEQNARFVDVERAAENGDRVIIDYSGSVDGVKFDGGTAEGQTLNLGSGMFIPGFEEQVVGMSIGEEKDIEVTFPEQYHSEELAGKKAVFAIKLHEIKAKEVPAIDDDLAADVSDFDTLDEYKADLLKKMEERAEKQDKFARENAVLEKALENAEVEIPECMIENQINYQMQEMEYSLGYQGITMEQYIQYTGMSLEDIREQYKPGAEKRVKSQLVMEAILKDSGIEVTDEDVDATIADMAKAQNKEASELKESIKEDQMEYIKERALFDKLVDSMVSAATVSYK